MTEQRVILDAALEHSVIRGTLITTTGDRRDFHGWLEFNTALEALLDSGGEHHARRGSGETSRRAAPGTRNESQETSA